MNSQNKKRLTQDQVRLLEESFSNQKKLDPELKMQLSRQLGIPARRIAIWYQNKRVRFKNESLGFEYNTLLRRLENATAQKRQLQTEVNRLFTELQNAQCGRPTTSFQDDRSRANCWSDDNIIVNHDHQQSSHVEQQLDYASIMAVNSALNLLFS